MIKAYLEIDGELKVCVINDEHLNEAITVIHHANMSPGDKRNLRELIAASIVASGNYEVCE